MKWSLLPRELTAFVDGQRGPTEEKKPEMDEGTSRSPDTRSRHKNPLHYRPLCASSIWIRRLKPAKARSVSRPHQNQNQNFGSVEDPVRRMKRGATDRENICRAHAQQRTVT